MVLADCLAARLTGEAIRLDGADPEAISDSLGDLVPVVVLYGPKADPELLRRLAGRGARFLGLPAGVNAAGAALHGLSADGAPTGSRLLYVYAADAVNPELPAHGAEFTVVHACYQNGLTESADLVLPALHWSEKAGHFTGPDGSLRRLAQVVPPAPWTRDDREVFSALVGLAEAAG